MTEARACTFILAGRINTILGARDNARDNIDVKAGEKDEGLHEEDERLYY